MSQSPNIILYILVTTTSQRKHNFGLVAEEHLEKRRDLFPGLNASVCHINLIGDWFVFIPGQHNVSVK